MTRRVLWVFKDQLMTEMMQKFDLFESFKFVGHMADSTQNDSHWGISAEELLSRGRSEKPKDKFELIGVIIPSADAAVLANYKVYSNGEKWTTIEKMCEFWNKRGDAKDAIVEKQIENIINGKENPMIVPRHLTRAANKKMKRAHFGEGVL